MLPLAIPRTSGGVQGGTFSAPCIDGSSAPALLGLKSLTEHRAILDMCSNQLHLLGPGEARLELTPGTESFNLERAPTGHLMLPFQEYSRLTESINCWPTRFNFGSTGFPEIMGDFQIMRGFWSAQSYEGSVDP